jgi:hypothetical protein
MVVSHDMTPSQKANARDCRRSVKFGQGVRRSSTALFENQTLSLPRAEPAEVRDPLLLCSPFVQVSVRGGANLVVTP